MDDVRVAEYKWMRKIDVIWGTGGMSWLVFELYTYCGIRLI